MPASRAGKVISDDFILEKVEQVPPKAIIVITKKVAPRAVDRNRARRIIKEALEEKVLGGQVRIIARKNFAKQKMQDVQNKLIPLLKKLS